MEIHTEKYRRIGNLIAKKYRNYKKNHRAIMLKDYPYSLEEFRTWILNKKEFIKLFKEWEESGFKRKLSPGLDRKDESKGYTFDNVIINTLEENQRNHGKLTRKGQGSSAHRGRLVKQYDKNMTLIAIHPSLSEAARQIGTTPINVKRGVDGKQKTVKGYILKGEN